MRLGVGPNRLRALLTPRRQAVLFLLPFAVGAVAQFHKPAHWFADFEAVACGGHALNAGRAVFAGAADCPGAQPTDYVYTPAVAQLVGALQSVVGDSGVLALYGGLFCWVVATVFRRLLADDNRLPGRAPFLAGLSGSALHSGNLSIVAHGLIWLGLRPLIRRPWIAVLPLAAAAATKPTFATYFALFLFLRRPLWQRLALAGAGGGAMLAYFMQFRAGDPQTFARWQELARFYGVFAERGQGFLGLPGIAALHDTAALAGGYLLFTVLLLGAGLILAQGLAREADRLLLGTAICVLLYPRLMAYDVYTLPFGIAVALGGFGGWGRLRAAHVQWVVRIACPVFGLTGGRLGGRLGFDLCCLLVLTLAAAALAQRRMDASRAVA